MVIKKTGENRNSTLSLGDGIEDYNTGIGKGIGVALTLGNNAIQEQQMELWQGMSTNKAKDPEK